MTAETDRRKGADARRKTGTSRKPTADRSTDQSQKRIADYRPGGLYGGGVPPFARRFVAGETPAEALEHVRALNERNVGALVNLLGSHNAARSRAVADAAAYRSLVEHVANADLDAGITLKPTQIGLDLGESVFREHLFEIAARASEREVLLWLDMEEPWTVEPTLAAFEDLAAAYDGVGVCVQADLKRTRDDLERLADVPGKVRLVKGAYDVPASVGYREKPRIDRAYRASLRYAFEQFDGGIAVASHDPEMIELAKALHDEHGTDFEIQMLMGVRPGAQFDLATTYEVRQYVPYGARWKQWALNRTRNDLRFAVEAVLRSLGGGFRR